MTRKRRTKLVRMYVDDEQEIKSRFPNVTMPDFIHIATRTNPAIQVEALLRGKKYVRKKKK